MVSALKTYFHEINAIDELLWNNGEELKTHQNQITAMLLILKRHENSYYKPEYEMLLEGLKHWLRCDRNPLDRKFYEKGKECIIEGTHPKYRNQVDPITFMNNYDWNGSAVNTKGASGIDVKYTLDVYLYCLDKFVKNKYMSRIGDTNYVYRNWLNTVDYGILE